MNCLYCQEKMWCIGLCRFHHQRWRYRVPLEAPKNFKYAPASFINLMGQQFGRAFVIDRADNKGVGKFQQAMWICQCDCGNTFITSGHNLRCGDTKSCGCLKIDIAKKIILKHGAASNNSRKPEYNIWQAMKQRCANPNGRSYKDYGGRGITVCDKWLNDFTAFFNDVGPRPSKTHSLDRIDVNKGYYPDNVKWSTPLEQSLNKRHLSDLETEINRLKSIVYSLGGNPNVV